MKGHHTPHTEETKRLISAKKRANPTRYWFGKKRPVIQTWLNSPEARAKRSKTMTGRRLSPLSRIKMILTKRADPSRPWLGKHRPHMSGDKNWNWKGGISKAYRMGYNSLEYRQWRRAVFERDGYRCQVCGITGTYLTAHHIQSFAYFPELRFIIDNGVTLCEPCHALTDNYKGRAKHN
jgi:hypothetical protein